MSENKRVLPQPDPKMSTGEDVWSEITRTYYIPAEVRFDMWERRALGVERYGMALRRGNGRDHYVDAYQEALDLLAYLQAANAPRLVRWSAYALLLAVRWCLFWRRS